MLSQSRRERMKTQLSLLYWGPLIYKLMVLLPAVVMFAVTLIGGEPQPLAWALPMLPATLLGVVAVALVFPSRRHTAVFRVADALLVGGPQPPATIPFGQIRLGEFGPFLHVRLPGTRNNIVLDSRNCNSEIITALKQRLGSDSPEALRKR